MSIYRNSLMQPVPWGVGMTIQAPHNLQNVITLPKEADVIAPNSVAQRKGSVRVTQC